MDIDGTLHIKGNLSTLYFSGPVKHIWTHSFMAHWMQYWKL
jgi:hypothetical protein